ncbi:MAG: formate dehydrogenase accessory sulfurtransferase FdhD [Nitrospirota bacterium]
MNLYSSSVNLQILMMDIKEFDVLRIENSGQRRIKDKVSVEKDIIIRLNNEEFVALMCTPIMVKELAVGFLLSEGLIIKNDDISEIDYNEVDGVVSIGIRNYSRDANKNNRLQTLTSGCGRGMTSDFIKGFTKEKKIESSIKIASKDITDISKEFINMSSVYKETGGVHSAALWDGGKIEAFCEDIGRHNAIDKIFGYCLMNNIPVTDKIILTSGRISSDVLIKISRRGMPVIISRNAPTSLAVEMAYFLGITLIGFVRGQRMNVYTYPERVVLGS